MALSLLHCIILGSAGLSLRLWRIRGLGRRESSLLSVAITMPAKDTYGFGDDIVFAADARLDGNVPCSSCSYQWVSSIDKSLGSRPTITVNSLTSPETM